MLEEKISQPDDENKVTIPDLDEKPKSKGESNPPMLVTVKDIDQAYSDLVKALVIEARAGGDE